jgi:hypothetical protein
LPASGLIRAASSPACAQVRQQLELEFLDLHQALPLVRQQVIDFFVQVPDLQFCLEVDLVVVLRANPVLRLLAVLAHHDHRRLDRCDA